MSTVNCTCQRRQPGIYILVFHYSRQNVLGVPNTQGVCGKYIAIYILCGLYIVQLLRHEFDVSVLLPAEHSHPRITRLIIDPLKESEKKP